MQRLAEVASAGPTYGEIATVSVLEAVPELLTDNDPVLLSRVTINM